MTTPNENGGDMTDEQFINEFEKLVSIVHNMPESIERLITLARYGGESPLPLVKRIIELEHELAEIKNIGDNEVFEAFKSHFDNYPSQDNEGHRPDRNGFKCGWYAAIYWIRDKGV